MSRGWVCPEVGVCPGGGVCPEGGGYTMGYKIPSLVLTHLVAATKTHIVGKKAVHILLEYFLIETNVLLITDHKGR